VAEDEEQFALIPALAEAKSVARKSAQRTRAKDKARQAFEPAPELPVARVLVDVPLAHLDRPFDYLVSAKQHPQVVVGSRVKVRFAGQDVDGFVVDRIAESDHDGRLAPLRRSVSAEPVLTRDIAVLTEAVAKRYAGTRSDVLRLAVPPRHATVEGQPSPAVPPPALDLPAGTAWWEEYDGGALCRRLAAGESARSVWTALPATSWEDGLAHAAAATLASGRGSVLCVPDGRDLERLDTALTRVLGEGQHVLLTAELGRSERYRSFLAVSRGTVRVVAGTRAAAFAPVHDLGLVAMWDDGDDLYAEPRAPYCHTREVLLLRSHQTGCAAVLGAFARSVEAASLVSSGWADDLAASRAIVRERAPRVSITGATDTELERDPFAQSARLPHQAHAAIRAALETGPVLVQAPRSGYAETLMCDRCRTPARCPACTGPLRVAGAGQPPVCRWCGTEATGYACPECGGRGLRAPVVGARRTVEELGRAFAGVPLRSSAGERVLNDVGPEAAIVVATPGAEPRAEGGYAAVVLLDTWLVLARPGLRAAEEAARRWFNAAALAREKAAGGQVVAVGDPAEATLQALVRWDPAGLSLREVEERRTAHLPPASRLAVLTAPEPVLEESAADLTLPAGAELLGPAPVTDERDDAPTSARLIIRVPRQAGSALSETLIDMQGVRSAKKLTPVKVQIDPYELA
jgi:primosomal protein N' (replication factor Y) (superfamily II helicase)